MSSLKDWDTPFGPSDYKEVVYPTTLDEIDQWLFDSFGILPGVCSSIESVKHTVARMVAEALWPKKEKKEMSKRAEERGLEALPPRWRKTKDGKGKVDSALPVRKFWIRAYEQAEKDLGWHSVDESLPPMDEEVIVLLGSYDDLLEIAFGHIVDKEIAVDYNGWNIPGVRYWMPMPEIPKEDKE